MLEKLKALLPHKLRAFSIHFLISLAIFAVLLYLILFHWYPGPWFAIDGGWPGVRIMVAVDLVLGPLLTFMVFNPAKSRREMGLDFSLIALIQIAALVWGVYLVHGQRPLAIVHWDGQFHSVDGKSAAFKNQSPDVLGKFGERRPVIVFQEEPDSEEKKIEMVMAIFGSDQAEYEHPELYRPLAPHLTEVFAQLVDAGKLRQQSPVATRKMDRLLARHGLTQADLRLVAFDGRYEQATLVFKADGTLLGALPALESPPRRPAAAPGT